jgi:predicted MFS family arabinose efflux permease
MGFLAAAPLLDSMAQRWSIAFTAASLLISVFGFAQMLLSIPTSWASGKVGFKPPVAVGASLLALGFLLRGTVDEYGLFLLFTVIAAVGWGIIFAPLAIWLPPGSRDGRSDWPTACGP